MISSCKIKQQDDLKKYLKENWQSPEEYILSKFKNHDYIFVGEFHRIKHDLDFIKKLIPRLYENGIYTLGFEFASHEMQDRIDSLVSMSKFDRILAQKIIFSVNPGFNYKDYIDVLEVVWNLNSQLRKKQKTFRIVGLTESYVKCDEGDDVWQDLDTDAYMADVILKEIVDKEEKALILIGMNHAVTKYQFPSFDMKKDSLEGYFKRTGNYVYDKVKDRTLTIFLHSPWPSLDFKGLVLPVHGKVDSIMDLFENKRIGFDVRNTPFGGLVSTNTFYKYGNQIFTLDKFCDGYIYQKRFTESQSVDIEKEYYTIHNIKEFKCFLRRLGLDEEFINRLTVEKANELDEDNVTKFFKLIGE